MAESRGASGHRCHRQGLHHPTPDDIHWMRAGRIPSSARCRTPLLGPKMTPRDRAEIWKIRSIGGFDNPPRVLFGETTPRKYKTDLGTRLKTMPLFYPFCHIFVDIVLVMIAMAADYNTPRCGVFFGAMSTPPPPATITR